jgi:hypothetical protein
VQPGEVVAILAETQSRRVNVDLARLALEAMGAKVFELTLTTPPLTAPAPVRSTGASDAIGQLGPVVAALARADMVVDCTVEGLLHAPELPTIMKGVDGHMPRLLMVSNEHPEILERTVPDPALEGVVRSAMKKLRAAQQMHVTSAAGTDLRVNLKHGDKQAVVGGVWRAPAGRACLGHFTVARAVFRSDPLHPQHLAVRHLHRFHPHPRQHGLSGARRAAVSLFVEVANGLHWGCSWGRLCSFSCGST